MQSSLTIDKEKAETVLFNIARFMLVDMQGF